MKRFILLAVVSACGNNKPCVDAEEYLDYGICYNSNGYTIGRAQFELVVETTIEKFAALKGLAVSDLHANLKENPVQVDFSDLPVGHGNEVGPWLEVGYSPCLVVSALAHELLHVLDLNFTDYTFHQDTEVFGGKGSLVYDIALELYPYCEE